MAYTKLFFCDINYFIFFWYIDILFTITLSSLTSITNNLNIFYYTVLQVNCHANGASLFCSSRANDSESCDGLNGNFYSIVNNNK